MIWMTSDLHLGHRKPFLYEPRGFSSIEEHDQKIVDNWNAVVRPDDDVYVLGDVMLQDNINGIKRWNELNGNKFLVIGNHDSAVRIKLLSDCPRTTILGYASIFKYHKYHFYLSHYPTLTSNYDYDKPLRARVINLCGHSHVKDKFADADKGLIYHVELDAHANYLVSIDTIIKEIKEYSEWQNTKM
jgi:calcineurin-like phosphoesterase family protein